MLHTILSSPNTRDPISSTGTRQLNNSGKRRVSLTKPILSLCCVDLFTIFVLLFQIYLLLSQTECFLAVNIGHLAVRSQGSVRWCSAKLARKIFASVRLVFLKVLHKVQLSFLSILNNMKLYHSTE